MVTGVRNRQPARGVRNKRQARPATALARPTRVSSPDSRSCYIHQPNYLGAQDRAGLLAWLDSLHPLWEMRFSTRRPPPAGRSQRPLLRPVYWLGNWQFACLGYYEPPRHVRDRAVAAEPFPPLLAALVHDIEVRIRRAFPAVHVPRAWHLNTCLVNFYGRRRVGDRWVDVARVGEHRDFEPGPVASLSLGERARFQFVHRGSVAAPPVHTEWLDDGTLQAFAGPHWKDSLLHRIQRVEDRQGISLPPAIEGFRTRRINLTFRYVPDRDVVAFAQLGERARDDVRDYVAELARHSSFYRAALDV